MAGPAVVEAHSFRDPAGQVLALDERILRRVNPDAMKDLELLLEAQARQKLQQVVTTKRLNEAPDVVGFPADSVWMEHERIPFVSYPYEWPAEMLYAAGSLTLDLAEEAMGESLGLKDATPYNLLFRGARPSFVDVLSFERRDRQDPTWLAQAQFERTFLNPLLAYKHLGIAVSQTLLARRDGLEPSELYHWLSMPQRLHRDFLFPVSVPHLLEKGKSGNEAALYRPRREDSADKAEFILGMMLRMCRRRLERAKPQSHASVWTGYMATNSYEQQQFASKEQFVREALAAAHPNWVLDVGCNTGHFSALAARAGANVVAVDQDPAVVGQVWRRAVEQNLEILPLVVDLARPTPAMGWRNAECRSFLERASERFDFVMMLAVIHHMLVTERIPLEEIMQAASQWTKKWLVVEFVAPGDAMFLRLTRGRDHLFRDLTRERFEAVCRRFFRVVRSREIPQSQRTVYLLSKEV